MCERYCLYCTFLDRILILIVSFLFGSFSFHRHGTVLSIRSSRQLPTVFLEYVSFSTRPIPVKSTKMLTTMATLHSRLVLTAILLFVVAPQAIASHFRYGHISWSRPSTTSQDVTFTITTGWRTSFGGISYDLLFGDGDSVTAFSSDMVQTFEDVANDYRIFVYTVTHTYAGTGPFTPYFDDCCRISAVGGGDYKVSGLVDLSDGSLGSPVSGAPVIVPMTQGAPNSIQLSAGDPDSDQLEFSLDTIAGAGKPWSAPSGLTISTSGILDWTTTGTSVGDLYVVRVLIDEVGKGSASEIDFFIEIIDGTANQPPTATLVNPPPVVSGNFEVEEGTTFQLDILGNDPDGDTLTIGGDQVPAGATLSPASGDTGTPPLTTTFEWTPTAADVGAVKSVIVSFTDTSGAKAFATFSLLATTSSSCNPTPSPPSLAVLSTACYTELALTLSFVPGPGGGSTITNINIQNLPSGVTETTTIGNPATVELGGAPDVVGAYTVGFEATDDIGAVSSTTLQLAGCYPPPVESVTCERKGYGVSPSSVCNGVPTSLSCISSWKELECSAYRGDEKLRICGGSEIVFPFTLNTPTATDVGTTLVLPEKAKIECYRACDCKLVRKAVLYGESCPFFEVDEKLDVKRIELVGELVGSGVRSPAVKSIISLTNKSTGPSNIQLVRMSSRIEFHWMQVAFGDV